jgi:chromosome segregation ATPase
LNLTNRELVERIEDHQGNLKTLKYRLELIERENQNSNEEIQKYRQKKMKIEQEKCALERQVPEHSSPATLPPPSLIDWLSALLVTVDPCNGRAEDIFDE